MIMEIILIAALNKIQKALFMVSSCQPVQDI